MTTTLSTIVFPETVFRRGQGIGLGGRYESIVVIPDTATSFTLLIDATKWTDPNLTCEYGAECSLDNGHTWEFPTSSDHHGGPSKTNPKTGELIEGVWHTCHLPKGAGRMLKVWFNPTNIRATITVGIMVKWQ